MLVAIEESGLIGAKNLVIRVGGHFVMLLMQVLMSVLRSVGAPTQMLISAKIFGKTAHASTPKEGVSAINIAAKAISRMKLGQVDEITTANIGKFHGGSATRSLHQSF